MGDIEFGKLYLPEIMLNPKRLLVIDDDITIRTLVTEAMSFKGYEVVSFETAEEAIGLLEKGDVPVALVDINLPGMSGIELLRQFAGNSSVAFILFTGQTETYTYEQAIHEGATDFLLKPIRLEELSLRIEKALETRRMWMAQEKLVGELERLAVTDELTGLSNRRRFKEDLKQEVKRAFRYGRPISVLAMDIDRFKKINDKYGHDVGDEALKAIGTLLQSDSRTEDHAYRSGGEEFTVLLPETTMPKATYLAERLREDIQDLRLADYSDLRMTVSIGIAEYHHEELPAEFFKRADKALYAAKREGRNRVVAVPKACDAKNPETSTRSEA